MFFLFDLVGGLFGLAIIFVIVGLVTGNLFFARTGPDSTRPERRR